MAPNAEFENKSINSESDGLSNVQLKEFSMNQVAHHNKRDDCYIVIKGKVYSVHDFINEHPGGDIIMTYAGEDATDVFAAFHPPSAYSLLGKYCVGELNKDDKENVPEFVKDARNLRIKFQQMGLYKSSKLYYTFKVLFNISIMLTSLYILNKNYGSTPHVVLAGFLMAVFWQQCGWLAHDFLHHQVFDNRSINNMMGYLIGNVFQGFSVDWWKSKHNTHHAVPNVHGEDPDVDTMPFLAWSEYALEGFSEGEKSVPKFLIDNQLFLYMPLLTFARFSWAIQSALWVKKHKTIPNHSIESVALAIHWLSLAAILIFLCGSFTNALVFLFVSQLSCGVLLSAVFSLNHNGMVIFSKEESKSVDYFTRQILTGRDVHPNTFSTWFTGGLNYQIEHHLFPMIPRHNFHLIQPHVQALCKKHNVSYHRTGFLDGTLEIFDRLSKIGSASKKI